MGVPIPKNKPARDQAWVIARLQETHEEFKKKAWDGKKLILFGCEGYFLNSMGKRGVNDRAIFDDALFILSDRVFVALNFNLDPGAYRPGHGHGSSKGMGTVHYGVYEDAYGIGKHKNIYPAIRQYGEIVVRRDADSKVPATQRFNLEGRSYYLESGSHQAMNIHPARVSSVSSLGCQTSPVSQWPLCINTVVAEVKRQGIKRFTYAKNRVQG